MPLIAPNEAELEIIRPIVSRFVEDINGKRLIPIFMESLLRYMHESRELQSSIHSVRSRIKDPNHLADKLLRKLREANIAGSPFDITPDNLFTRVNDLAGIRIIHLHTRQIPAIDHCIKAIVEEQPIEMIEGPTARSWDDESRSFFSSIGIETKDSGNTMYTSIHYVVASGSNTKVTCELQVRTLMEEVWGEVDHSLNYPHPNEHVACREQLKALARATSSASRLVDSIFATVEDFERQKAERSGE